jgi:hypothetical protein
MENLIAALISDSLVRERVGQPSQFNSIKARLQEHSDGILRSSSRVFEAISATNKLLLLQ